MPFDIENSVEAQSLLNQIKYSPKFLNLGYNTLTAKMRGIAAKAQKSPDPIKFLQATLKKFNPAAKLWNPKMKIGPGQTYGLPVPNVALSTGAAKFMPSPEKQAQAKALQAKIDAHNAEIRRLEDAREKARKAASKAEADRKNLGSEFDEKTLKYFSYIEENCSEYLKSVKETKKLLYRGQNDTSLPIFVGYPRKDRHTSDSDPEAQEMYDKNLLLAGFKALRSNSIFTTSDKDQAGPYGDLYAIFPKNGFAFTWSTKESDLVLGSIRDVDRDAESSGDIYYDFNEQIESDMSELYYQLDNMGYRGDKALAKKLKASPFVKAFNKISMVWDRMDPVDYSVEEIQTKGIEVLNSFIKLCDNVPELKKLLSSEYKGTTQLLANTKKKIAGGGSKANKVSAVKMIKKFGLLKTNLSAALKSGNEVCILGEYVAVDWNKYEDQIRGYFLPKTPVKKKPKAMSPSATKLLKVSQQLKKF